MDTMICKAIESAALWIAAAIIIAGVLNYFGLKD